MATVEQILGMFPDNMDDMNVWYAIQAEMEEERNSFATNFDKIKIAKWLTKVAFFTGAAVLSTNKEISLDFVQYFEELQFVLYMNKLSLYIDAGSFNTNYGGYYNFPKNMTVPTDEEIEEIIKFVRQFFPRVKVNVCKNCRSIFNVTNGICRSCEEEKLKPVSKSGYVYLLSGLGGKIFKIGCSRHPKQREFAFDKIMPFKVELIHSIAVDNKYKSESELHFKFKDKRLDGEWFDLNEEDVAFIMAL